MKTSPFSIFIPVYNEEALLVPNTEKLLAFLAPFRTTYEVLIGSNGSTDRTRELGRELARKHAEVRFFHLDRKGPGLAFREAVDRTRFERLVCLDMDLSVALEFIPEALALLDKYDAVIGSKKMGIERRSFVRRAGSDLFIACCKKLLGMPYNDFSMGAKAWRKELLVRYKSGIDRETAYTQNIVFAAHHAGFPIIQIPIQCHDERTSRFHLAWEGLYRFTWLFRLWLQRRPAPRPAASVASRIEPRHSRGNP